MTFFRILLQEEIANSPSRGLTEVKFNPSVPMVTYLACFIVCDFDHRTLPMQSGKKFSVYATKDQIDGVEYALQIGRNISNFFENYFGLPYPLPKQGKSQ